jgi:hypothetical protein
VGPRRELESSPHIYFARAIDGEDLDTALSFASGLADELADLGLRMVDPVRTEPRIEVHVAGGRRYEAIVEHDLSILRRCDAVLMDMTKADRNYIGCICEMTYAYIWHIPCVVYVGESSNKNRAWLQYHATAVFESRDDAVRHLLSMFGGDWKSSWPSTRTSTGNQLLHDDQKDWQR